jgi:hypothetical protein
MATKTFERQTICPDCYSNRIRVLEDDGSGVCWDCKCLIDAPIIGGFGRHEAMRLRGKIKPGRTANEIDKEQIEKERRDSELLKDKIKKDLSVVDEVKRLVTKKEEPKKEEPKKKGFFERALGAMVEGFARGVTKATDKANEIKDVSPIPKGGEDIRRTRRPVNKNSDKWSVGPCMTCGIAGKFSGRGIRNTRLQGKSRYIVVDCGDGRKRYGCLLCSQQLG